MVHFTFNALDLRNLYLICNETIINTFAATCADILFDRACFFSNLDLEVSDIT